MCNWLQVLKPQCVDALTRIFKLCDMDKDNVLNDKELNEFQVCYPSLYIYYGQLTYLRFKKKRKCFNTPLQQNELDGVKEVVREHEPAGVNENGLTEIG